jgi:hypothetical protein
VILVFQSDRFRPYLPDDCQVNPNVLGFELAAWLSRELARSGIITSYPLSEDWGWFLEREVDGTDYMICCSGEAVDEDTFEWRVFVSPVKRMFQKPKTDGSSEVLKSVRAVLDAEGLPVTEEAEGRG